MINRRTSLIYTGATLGTLSALSLAGHASAQAKYPDQPVKFIVALPAGGGVDMIARTLAQKLTTNLGQPFLIDNRAGGSGQIGMPIGAKAPADGYTLTVSPASFLTTNKSIFKSLSYDPEADFAPVTRLVNQAMILVVKDKQKYPTMAAFLADAKANPGKITYASSGDGSPQHLAGLMFETRAQTKLLHVPYRGGALAINDTIAGTVDAIFAVMPEAVQHIKAGTLHPLGVMTAARSSIFPQVPTMVESGVADLVLPTWIALLAPAKTPKPIIDQINRAVAAAFDPETRAKLAEIGMDVAPAGPEDLQRLIARDIKIHAELVKAAGLVPQ
jgi:tripartite-type tricarboxylate transporter receptor subunit TctC